LHTVVLDETAITLRALVDHRDDLVKARTQTVNRLHVLLIQLIPVGAPQHLSAEATARLLRPVRPRTPLLATLLALAEDLIAEIRRLDQRITASTGEITTAVAASGTTLTQLHDCPACTGQAAVSWMRQPQGAEVGDRQVRDLLPHLPSL
jgi:transposase